MKYQVQIFKWLPALLSIIAGSLDVISFLGLNGLFVSHITGNLVILAVRIVHAGEAPVALVLAVPVFILVLILARLLMYRLELEKLSTLKPLLWLQFLFILGYCLLTFSHGTTINANSIPAITAGMFGVASMAIQNALVQLSLKSSPTTAVMTTNITRFFLDLGEYYLGTDPEAIKKARIRAWYTWPPIGGFILGCALGAFFENIFGLRALVLPAILALSAIFIVCI
ncbi:MAG: DUF1275 domain-containing protein [Proteobacteria bacterium]|nr:DUF1275 domain-containing protein [Pseudomonadota bacterium]